MDKQPENNPFEPIGQKVDGQKQGSAIRENEPEPSLNERRDGKKISKPVVAIATATILALAALLSWLLLICHHTEWTDATCTEPRACVRCGLTEGEPLGHEWKGATCTEPQRCARCNAKKGQPTEHKSGEFTVEKEATCTEYGAETAVCTVCSAEVTRDIPKADHTPGEWSVAKEPEMNADGTVDKGKKNLTCAICGQVMKIEEYASFVNDGKFTLCAGRFAEGFEKSSKSVKGYDIDPKVVVDDSKLFFEEDNYLFYELQDTNNNYRTMGMMAFLEGSDKYVPYSEEYSTDTFDGILFLVEDASDVSAILFAAILTIDPALGYNEAADFGQSVVDNAGSPEGVSINGINYVILKDGGSHFIKISVE